MYHGRIRWPTPSSLSFNTHALRRRRRRRRRRRKSLERAGPLRKPRAYIIFSFFHSLISGNIVDYSDHEKIIHKESARLFRASSCPREQAIGEKPKRTAPADKHGKTHTHNAATLHRAKSSSSSSSETQAASLLQQQTPTPCPLSTIWARAQREAAEEVSPPPKYRRTRMACLRLQQSMAAAANSKRREEARQNIYTYI